MPFSGYVVKIVQLKVTELYMLNFLFRSSLSLYSCFLVPLFVILAYNSLPSLRNSNSAH